MYLAEGYCAFALKSAFDWWTLLYYLLNLMLFKQYLLLVAFGEMTQQLLQRGVVLMDGEPVDLPQCLTCRDVVHIHVVLHFILHMAILLIPDGHDDPDLALCDVLVQVLHCLYRVRHLHIDVCLVTQ